MKLVRITLQICAIGVLMHSRPAMAQDADKQKLMEIEKVFATQSTPGPQAAVVRVGAVRDAAHEIQTAVGREVPIRVRKHGGLSLLLCRAIFLIR